MCFLRRSDEELMAVKETHKEPERLTDKVSAFDILFPQFYFISMLNSDVWHWPVFFKLALYLVVGVGVREDNARRF